ESRLLQGEVRIDDAYLGGERTGGKVGRGSENKVPFVAAVELHDGRPWRVRFDQVESFSRASLQIWAKQALAPNCHVVSDGLAGFAVLEQLGHRHDAVIAPKRKAGTEIEPFRWLNTLLGNLKTALSGTYHAFKFKKYAPRYLSEVQYRFNRRFELKALVPRLAFAVMHTKPCARLAIIGLPEE
ncbi:IS1595 family transposase, partial [Chitinilyticum litopenaei]|uniref:IS1595 family transposase n=1 Tax=Chitinilyticum litopenaei TaxID=1121276 RepID=UPI0005BCBABC